MTITIDSIHLPLEIERGATGGPNFRTTVMEGDAGRTVTNQNWSQARRVWRFTYGYMDDTDFETLIAFFLARAGQAYGFLFKDWTDYKTRVSPNVINGDADGVATDFPLFRLYTDSVRTVARRIYRPVSATIAVKINGTPTSAWSLIAPGIVRFVSAPSLHDIISASFEYDIPVMFRQDNLDMNVAYKDAVAFNEIQIIELRE